MNLYVTRIEDNESFFNNLTVKKFTIVLIEYDERLKIKPMSPLNFLISIIKCFFQRNLDHNDDNQTDILYDLRFFTKFTWNVHVGRSLKNC